jgi:hypothetical protein
VQDSKFWRSAAVLIIAAVLYVGHGLHNGGTEGVPSLVNTAHAGGVAVDAPYLNGVRTYGRIYTADPSGTYLYVWDAPTLGAIPKYIATVKIPRPEKKLPGPQLQAPSRDEPLLPPRRTP